MEKKGNLDATGFLRRDAEFGEEFSGNFCFLEKHM
jgi:hypothetical protein